MRQAEMKSILCAIESTFNLVENSLVFFTQLVTVDISVSLSGNLSLTKHLSLRSIEYVL